MVISCARCKEKHLYTTQTISNLVFLSSFWIRYLRPFLTNFSFEICKDLLELITSRTFLAVDSNAKTLLWNSATMGGRTRGEETMGEQPRRRPGMFYTKTRPLSCNSESAPSLDFVPSGTSFFNVTALIDDQVNLSHWFFSSIPYHSDPPWFTSRYCFPPLPERISQHPGKFHISLILMSANSTRKF